MTEPAANLRAVDEMLDFTTAEEAASLGIDDSKSKKSVPFRMDGEVFVLRRPKTAIALTMLHMAAPEDARTVNDLGSDLIQLVSQTINYIEAEPPDADGNLHGKQRILQRLSDPDDPLDVPHLFRPFQSLIEKLFLNPTGSRPASGRKPRRALPDSGGRSRGKRAATSTTSTRTS